MAKRLVRTFIYKRTHKGDPRIDGCFGIEDCMGKLRGCDFDSVIGVGGIGSLARSQNIDGKVNWIGVGPRKKSLDEMRGPLVTFSHFVLFEENGRDLEAIAPKLARRLLSRWGPRFVFSNKLDKAEQEEVSRILEMAKTEAPSLALSVHRAARKRSRCAAKKC